MCAKKTDPAPSTWEELEARVADWARRERNVRAAIVIGSRARSDHPADEWSDLDMILIVNNPRRFIESDRWVHGIAEPWLTFTEPTPAGSGTERRVVFPGGRTIDFVIESAPKRSRDLRVLSLLHKFPALFSFLPGQLRARIDEDLALAAGVYGRGIKVLADKDGFANRFQDFLPDPPPWKAPTQAEFTRAVARFWHDSLWTANHLRRGELWWGKSGCDYRLKRDLLLMIEWHARATLGADHDTWQNGRFLEEWAPPETVSELRQTFAHYDADDIRRALFATASLFKRLAKETAALLQLDYPQEVDERISAIVAERLPENPGS